MTELTTVHEWPTLERPVLVVAMEGWVDAGLAAGTATAVPARGHAPRAAGHFRR